MKRADAISGHAGPVLTGSDPASTPNPTAA